MRKTNFTKLLFSLMLVFILALTACSEESSKPTDDPGKKTEGKGEKGKEKGKEDKLYSIEDFSTDKTNKGEAMEGGTLKFGLVSDTPFEGTLNPVFYSGAPDAEVMQWFDEGLLAIDENYMFTNDGAATIEVDKEVSPNALASLPADVAKEVAENGVTFTLTIRDNVNWHDSKPVTAQDWAYAFEVIGHPKYDGVRYGSDLANIVGMDAYHAGEAKNISGIEIINDKTMKLTYKQSTPSLLNSGIWDAPLAKHIFEKIPVEKMASSKEVREKPIGFGPFKVESIVPGESVVYIRNDDYWQGKPKLDKVELKVINSSVVVQALEKGEVDMVGSFPTDQYADNADMSNVEFLGKVGLSYTYIGFKLGTWDKENSVVKTNPDAKMADVNLRRAMWHAVDNDLVGKKFYNGLRWNATTLIPPSHPEFNDETNKGRTYDPEKAKKMLDEAGFKDVDGDGYREDQDGKPLVINFASMSGGDTAEPLAQYYIQAWKAVGLNVELLDGRLHEFNSFYDRVEADDKEIDIYQGAWNVGADVNPFGLYGKNDVYNYSRFEHPENDRLLEAGISKEAFDVEKRKEIYNEWQQLMVDEVPVFPTVYRATLVPVNNRVVNYSIATGNTVGYHELAVTQDEPFKK